MGVSQRQGFGRYFDGSAEGDRDGVSW